MQKKREWILLNSLNKRGDVWVSAVLYFGLGVVVLALILGAGLPVINRLKDKNIATQTKDVFSTLDSNIREVTRGGPGTQRIFDLTLAKGQLIVYDERTAEDVTGDRNKDTIKQVLNGVDRFKVNNRLVWAYDVKAALSEPGLLVEEGSTKILTTGGKGSYKVRFWLDYEPNIYLKLESGANTISGGSKISIKNLGSQCINLKDAATSQTDFSPAGSRGADTGKCTQDSLDTTLSGLYTNWAGTAPDPRITIQISVV